jgi:hypothetical protein
MATIAHDNFEQVAERLPNGDGDSNLFGHSRLDLVSRWNSGYGRVACGERQCDPGERIGIV